MSFLLSLDDSPTMPLPITSKAGEFTLFLRRPTFAESMRHDALVSHLDDDPEGHHFAALIALRVSLVTGWNGVKTTKPPESLGAGEAPPIDVEFSLKRFQQLLLKSPESFDQFSRKAAELLRGEPVGESAAAPVTG
jgi:hypothetical protein